MTLDSDLHAILASLHIKNTSVIRIRIEGLKDSALAQILVTTISSLIRELMGRKSRGCVKDEVLRGPGPAGPALDR